ncbi:Hypothetical predicted protein [Marmota monax]|uniref:Uncharacterized protein n=1 Tax=Marmota monax TaxID=9995 RepID=A0A5E4CV09_MARMO|nr:Hypothetical predicted protein [Marmota monax]
MVFKPQKKCQEYEMNMENWVKAVKCSMNWLEGARSVGASISRASTRQATDSRLPPSAGARGAAAPEDVPQALPDRLAWPPGPVHPSGGFH